MNIKRRGHKIMIFARELGKNNAQTRKKIIARKDHIKYDIAFCFQPIKNV